MAVRGGKVKRGRACGQPIGSAPLRAPESRPVPCNSPLVPTDCPLDFVPSRVYRLETRGLLTSAPASINMRTTVSLPDEAAAWIGRTPSRTELTG